MSFLDAWIDRVARNRGYNKAVDNNALLASVLGSGKNQSNELMGGDGVDERVAIRSSWVFSNIDVVGKLAAESQLEIKQQKEGGGYVADLDHPFSQLFRRPNPFMSKSYIIRYTSMWLQLRGSAAWLLVPDGTGELAQIWPLPADRIKPIADSKDYISGYRYKPEGYGKQDVFLPVENICYFREPSLFSYREGMSKLDALRVAIETDRQASGWNLETFLNDVALRTLISLPPDISRGTFTQVKAEILTQLVDERKRFIIARGGELKAESIGLTHKDLEFLSGREFTREEIDRVFGFPAGFWAKEATEANSRTAMNVVIDMSVWPQLTMISEEITAQILTRYYEDEIIIAEFTDIRRGDKELKLKQNDQRFESMTIDEVRAELGLEPHADKQYGAIPWPLRDDPRSIALFIPVDAIADGTLHIDEIGNNIRDEQTQDEPDKGIDEKAIKREWERYKSIAKRRVRSGENASVYSFDSGLLDSRQLQLTRFMLAFATTPDDTDKAFHWHDDLGDRKAVTEQGNQLNDAIAAAIALYVSGELTASEFEAEIVRVANQFAGEAAIAGYGDGELPEDVNAELVTLGTANLAAATRLRELVDKQIAEGLPVAGGIVESVINLWTSRPDYVFALALVHTKANPLLTWRRGGTLKPCGDCLDRDGVTKRAAEWLLLGILPQSSALACKGFYCACGLFEENPGT